MSFRPDHSPASLRPNRLTPNPVTDTLNLMKRPLLALLPLMLLGCSSQSTSEPTSSFTPTTNPTEVTNTSSVVETSTTAPKIPRLSTDSRLSESQILNQPDDCRIADVTPDLIMFMLFLWLCLSCLFITLFDYDEEAALKNAIAESLKYGNNKPASIDKTQRLSGIKAQERLDVHKTKYKPKPKNNTGTFEFQDEKIRKQWN